MERRAQQNSLTPGCTAVIASIISFIPFASRAEPFEVENPLNRPGLIYWCPERTPDQQYTSTPQAGCTLLVGEEDRRKAEQTREHMADWVAIEISNIQQEASTLVREYRDFLECCVTDTGSIRELEQLEARSIEILMAIQRSGLINAAYPGCLRNCRGFTTSEIIRSVARIRDDVQKLKSRLVQLADAMARASTLDYVRAGQARRQIQIDLEVIAKEFRYKGPPEAPPTGTEIEDTTLPNRIGTDIVDTSLATAFGPDIGYVVSPDNAHQRDLAPRSGIDTQSTSLATRAGTALGGGNTPATTLRTTTGFEIDTPQGPTGVSTTPSRVGPAIADSSLNQQR